MRIDEREVLVLPYTFGGCFEGEICHGFLRSTSLLAGRKQKTERSQMMSEEELAVHRV